MILQWRNNEPSNDIARYFEIAQEEGLSVVLRPGPYICGERDWGGFPSWLSTVPGLTVRTYNEPYLNYSTRYLQRLAADLQHLQVTKGGPLLMVQVENEVSDIPRSLASSDMVIAFATHQ